MLQLITEHRADIERRIRELLLARSAPKPTRAELRDGIPLLIEQLIDGLARRRLREDDIDRVASDYGQRLFALGFTVSELVHGYGAVCEVVTTVAQELGRSFTTQDFEILNRILDVAIAGAVTAYQEQGSEAAVSREIEHLGFLAHELRNALAAAVTAFEVLKQGKVGLGGRTAEVVDRSLQRMGRLLDRALVEVRLQTDAEPVLERMRVADVLDEVATMIEREAGRRRQRLDIDVDHALELDVDRQLFTSALSNLVQNAIKYTPAGGRVAVRAVARGDRLEVEVEDECGGLPPGQADTLFQPFVRGTTTQGPGLGLGLSIVARATRALGGEVRVRDLPGRGCVFSVELPGAVTANAQRSAPAP